MSPGNGYFRGSHSNWTVEGYVSFSWATTPGLTAGDPERESFVPSLGRVQNQGHQKDFFSVTLPDGSRRRVSMDVIQRSPFNHISGNLDQEARFAYGFKATQAPGEVQNLGWHKCDQPLANQKPPV